MLNFDHSWTQNFVLVKIARAEGFGNYLFSFRTVTFLKENSFMKIRIKLGSYWGFNLLELEGF